jgi:uracil-DNA glycosylase family 4
VNDLRGCRLCPRLVAFRKEQQARHPGYHNQPVGSFGADRARLLIVGLAPGLHGANATGRPFTGDSSGSLLFETLHRFQFANLDRSLGGDDGLRLRNCRITNAVKCLPPENRPLAGEINTCNRYLRDEISALAGGSVLLALGTVAHRAILRAMDLKQSSYRFRHAAEYSLPNGLKLFDSYHPSRYNQNTGRLTGDMLAGVFERVEAVSHD